MPDKEEEKTEEETAAATAEDSAADETAGTEAEAEAEVGAEVEADTGDDEPEAEAADADDGEADAVAAEEETAAKKPAKKKAAPKKAKKKKKEPRTDVKVPAFKAVTGTELKLNPDVFEVDAKIGVIHEVVVAEMAARRKGTASTKKRGEVRGGGAKPWRQKGTGRARAGSSRIPHWTGGGVAFGPKPRNFCFKVNRKMRSKALRMALSARAREGSFKVVDGLSFEEPKTAAAAAVLAGLDVTYPLLVLVDVDDANTAMSFRNLPRVDVTDTDDLQVADVVGARTVLVTAQALERLNAIGEGK